MKFFKQKLFYYLFLLFNIIVSPILLAESVHSLSIDNLDELNQTLGLARKTGNYQQEIFILRNIGEIYDHLGEYTKALEKYSQSLKISKQFNDLFGEGAALLDIGNVYIAITNLVRYSLILESHA